MEFVELCEVNLPDRAYRSLERKRFAVLVCHGLKGYAFDGAERFVRVLREVYKFLGFYFT